MVEKGSLTCSCVVTCTIVNLVIGIVIIFVMDESSVVLFSQQKVCAKTIITNAFFFENVLENRSAKEYIIL
jgi:hypothetical protein